VGDPDAGNCGERDRQEYRQKPRLVVASGGML
jgi:hypothetical protein